MQRQSGNGLIVWYDLITSEPENTESFYTALFGWNLDGVAAPSTPWRTWLLNEIPIGRVIAQDAELGAGSWMNFIQLDDLDSAVDLVEDLGGTVHIERTELPDHGAFAIVADPVGAICALFQSIPERRATITRYNRGDGYPIWNELITTDIDASTNFYRNLTGWQMKSLATGANSYNLAQTGNVATAGIFQSAIPPAHPMWIVSFQTSDIDASIAKVQQLGGSIVHPVNNAPGIGRTAWVADPAGIIFGLMEPEIGWLDRL